MQRCMKTQMIKFFREGVHPWLDKTSRIKEDEDLPGRMNYLRILIALETKRTMMISKKVKVNQMMPEVKMVLKIILAKCRVSIIMDIE